MISSYHLRPTDKVLSHGLQSPQLLHDYQDDDIADRLQIADLIGSGNCFINLATNLEESIQLLSAKPEIAGPKLKDIILTLFYLQEHYQVCAKPLPFSTSS